MLRVPVLAILLAAVAAAPAAASTAGVQGTTLSVLGAAGERNGISITVSGASVVVADSRATIAAGPGCTLSEQPRSVSCPRDGLADLAVDLGDRDDRVTVVRSLDLRGRLRGGSGNDTLSGGGGPDELDGGTGRDTVSYGGLRDPLTVTIGAAADDGAPGEGDDVAAAETVVGGSANDALTGTGAGERLDGRGGDDRLDGRGGDDTLVGGTGDDAMGGGDGNDAFVANRAPDGSDVLAGGAGVDRADYAARRTGVVADPDGFADDGERAGGSIPALGPIPNVVALVSGERDNLLPDVESVRGGVADDVLVAGREGRGRVEGRGGTDTLYGGPGLDRLEGNAGFDRIASRDRTADSISCGTEVDRVYADPADQTSIDCEVRRASFAVALEIGDRTRGAEPRLQVRVTCPAYAAVRCVGAVRAATVRRVRSRGGRLRPLPLGAARFNAPAGTAVSVDVPLSAAGVRALDRLAPTRVRVAARGRDESGPGRAVAARRIVR